ncbi:hypothetical protein SAY86_008940 [Trapa natans]|uniref:Uncharacterized protein n=1 Tax=Trapa natans TaxID=22666 RepID=A0AAN7QBU8_TRANT|nr:hypothetical protein SAY86_008940 [Trapa natans]
MVGRLSYVQESADLDMEDGDTLVDDDDDEHIGHDFVKQQRATSKIITTAMVDAWWDESAVKLGTMTSDVFNKTMISVFTEMDRTLGKLSRLPSSGRRKEMMMDTRHCIF